MYERTGMGEYPGFYCYDKDRPSWMPYWWDTWGESVCKVKAVPGNIFSCVNPLSTDCASTRESGSYFNARESVGLKPGIPNKDASISGPGIAPEGEPTNEPELPPDAPSNYTVVALLVAAVAALSIVRN